MREISGGGVVMLTDDDDLHTTNKNTVSIRNGTTASWFKNHFRLPFNETDVVISTY